MNKICEWHKPKNQEMNYIEWFPWAERQYKSGKKQKQCPICKKWFFPSEFGKEPDSGETKSAKDG